MVLIGIYNDGAYENIIEAKEYFPGWTPRFYCSIDSPVFIKLLEEQEKGNCEVVAKQFEGGARGMFWRLEAISDPQASHVIIRDTDQRLSDKDAQTTKLWLESGQNAYRMHEEGGQSRLILMGCAWGIMGGVITDIDLRINRWLNFYKGYSIGARFTGDAHAKRKNLSPEDSPRLYYGADQIFLEEEVWPEVRNSCVTYGILGNVFPSHKPLKWGGEFMFRRITPNTGCKEIFGERPGYAYQTEEK